MSDSDLSKDPVQAPAPRPVRRGVKPLVVAGLVAVAGIGGMVAARAVDGPGFGPSGWMHGPMMMRGFGGHFGGPRAMDPAALQDRVDRGVRHIAVDIDATPDQQDKLRAVARDLVKDLLPLRDTRAEMASRARTLLTAEKVDKAEVEKFRAEQVARMDTASKRIAKAIDDVSDVLTVEQRRKLADRLPPAGSFGPGR